MKAAKIGDAWLHGEAEASGRTVVYVNSLGSDLRIWDGVVAALRPAGFGALRYDLRGHGLSDLGTPPKLIADHVADLAGVMEAFGVGRATICGVSVGGVIALGLAQAHPGKVERLALSNTGAKIGTPETWNPRIAAVEQGGVGGIAQSVLERWFPAALREADDPSVALARNMLTRTPAAGYVATCVALRDSDLTEAARSVKVPTLCIGGSLDGSTPPALVRALAALVPGAEYFEIEGAGHLPCLQTPAAFAERLLRFLN
jgi:3-oxoadipate enol-lactonase